MLVNLYAEHKVPVGGIIIDSPWSQSYNDFNWDRARYPEAEKMLKSFNEQNKTMDNLSNFITDDVKLIVVDSIISHYRSELAQKKQGIKLNKQLNQQVAQLKDIAMRRNIMILVVNQVRADMNSRESQGFPLSKKVFDHWSDLELQFVIHPENKIIRVSFLNKHPKTSKQGSKCQFKIANEGII